MFTQLTIVGNLGSDPEMRYLPDGTAVTNISVATNRRWNSKDGTPHEQTTWFRVSVWGKQAEAANQYLAKGRQVLVVGQLQPDENGNPRIFQRNDGTAGASYEVRASSVQFLGKNGNGSGAAAPTQEAQKEEEDEIPF